MYINTWNQTAHLKSRLLELVDVLISDQNYSREEIARDLLANIQSLNLIEEDISKLVIAKDYKKLYAICEEKEDER